MRHIVITGPESTGKTELASQLASYYNCIHVPEYARSYIEGLTSKYTEQDVLKIAEKQIEQYRYLRDKGQCAIFDTWLIITKVWMKLVFNKEIEWIHQAIQESKMELYLLCANDLPWVPDPVRENGGAMRDKLFDMYRQELLTYKIPFIVISGSGEERLSNAIFAIDEYFKNKSE